MTELTTENLANLLSDLEKQEKYDDDEDSSCEYSEGVFDSISRIRREFDIKEPEPESFLPPLPTGHVGTWEYYPNEKNSLDNDMYFELRAFPLMHGKLGKFYGAGWWADSYYGLKEEISKLSERSDLTTDRIELQEIRKDEKTGHIIGAIIIT